MKIQSINYINPYFQKSSISNNQSNSAGAQNIELQKTSIPADIVHKTQKEEAFFRHFLTRKGKVTYKEYQDIVKNHPRALIEAQKLIEKENPTQSSTKDVANAAVKLKKLYDKEYKNKYTIVSIGTSPSPITEVMSALGAKVVFLPASGLNDVETNNLYVFRKQYPTIASRQPNAKHIIEYAKANGINHKNNNFIVLLDYCCSGASLDKVCTIFEEEDVYNSKKAHDRSILSDLAQLTNLNVNNSDFRLESFANLSHDMQASHFEKVSNVPHFYILDQYNETRPDSISSKGKSKHRLFKEFDDYSKPLARAYSLCAIHEAMKMSNK